jgi:hypothetical protein
MLWLLLLLLWQLTAPQELSTKLQAWLLQDYKKTTPSCPVLQAPQQQQQQQQSTTMHKLPQHCTQTCHHHQQQQPQLLTQLGKA